MKNKFLLGAFHILNPCFACTVRSKCLHKLTMINLCRPQIYIHVQIVQCALVKAINHGILNTFNAIMFLYSPRFTRRFENVSIIGKYGEVEA